MSGALSEPPTLFELPDGTTVDYMRSEGADEYIAKCLAKCRGHPDISVILRDDVMPFRNSNSSSRSDATTPADSEEFMKAGKAYAVIGWLVRNASPHVYATIPKEHLQVWIDHVVRVLRGLTSNPRWFRTGILEYVDSAMLESAMLCTHHYDFVRQCLDGGFYSAMAQLVAARKCPGMPCPCVSDLIVSVVCVFHHTMVEHGEKQKIILERLESSGLLCQYFRCITMQDSDNGVEVLDCLAQCPTLVQKRISRGTATGDALLAILAGEDGCRQHRNAAVLTRFENLAKMADLTAAGPRRVNTSCSKCHVIEGEPKTFRRCSRCGYALYCSVDCQKAHWREHKKMCRPRTEFQTGNSGIDDKLIQEFCLQNFVDVTKQLVIQNSTDIIDGREREFVVVLDFWAGPFGATGIAPALKSPPEFEVRKIHEYDDGHEVSRVFS